jgi:phage FluMu protein Com
MAELTRYGIDLEPRCHGCGKLLAMMVARPWTIRCPRCKADNSGEHYGHPRSTRVINVGDA